MGTAKRVVGVGTAGSPGSLTGSHHGLIGHVMTSGKVCLEQNEDSL